MQNFSKYSVKNLIANVDSKEYTKQTLISLFRCFLESAIDAKEEAVILLKLSDEFLNESFLSKIKYSSSNVYLYSQRHIQDYECITADNKIEKDEFLIIIADRFSLILYWEKTSNSIYDVRYSLNGEDSLHVIKHLQSLYTDNKLEQKLEEIRKDRRNNDKQTSIIRKLGDMLDAQHRDLLCSNLAIEELEKEIKTDDNIVDFDKVASSIAHEIRNPLGMLSLYSKIISKNINKLTVPETQAEIIDSIENASYVINDSCTGLDKILTGLVDYAKPLKLDREMFCVSEAIDEVYALVKPSFEEKNISLNNLSKESIEIDFDKTRLKQILLNVLKNALETSRDGGKVEIKTTRYDNDLYIDIKDEGYGVSKENVDKIFNPYFTTKKDGTGIGLAESKKIMRAHGGELALLSTSKEGSIFRLTLPL